MSFKPRVKIAIIGAGLIGPRHAQAVLAEAEAELTCFVDPHPATGAIASRLSVPWYRDIQAMVQSKEKPDAAIVCTPNHTHVAVSTELLDANIHVLVEKPISVDSMSGNTLVLHAAHRGLHLLVGHHRRFNAQVRAAKELLGLSSLGNVVAVQGIWALYKPPSYFNEPATWRRSRTSGGPVMINLIHDVDILLYLFGPIARVYAEEAIKQRNYEAEEGAAITLRFKNGIVGTFVLSDAVSSPWALEAGTGENPQIPKTSEPFLRVMGSHGSLSLGDMKKWSYEGKDEPNWGTEMVADPILEDSAIPFSLQVRHLVRVLRGLETPVCTGEDGLRAVIVCEAVKRSMETGLPIAIDCDCSNKQTEPFRVYSDD
jgi:predicted dehydrogenase